MKHIKRKEVKFLINEEEYLRLNEEFRPHLVRNEFHFQTLHNIYFDNDESGVIIRSLEKPTFKQKLRLRAYQNQSGIYPYAFIELKKKFKGIVYKRRLKLDLSAGNAAAAGELDLTPILDGTQIGREINFFISQTLSYPKIYIAYDRYSFDGKHDKGLRVTFDSCITSRTTRLALNSSPEDVRFHPPKEYLLEIKANGGLPLWLTAILTKCQCFPSSFSKYGEIYKASMRTPTLT